MCLVFFIFLSILPNISHAKHYHSERYYQEWHCAKHEGVMEFPVKDGRVDCLTEKLAIEYDFASKGYECIGQALYYAGQTKRPGACILIIESKKDSDLAKKFKNLALNNGVKMYYLIRVAKGI